MRSLLCALPVLALVACQQLNPNSGRFSCETGADCGAGYECRPQFSGGARCFKVGDCVDTEVCDGADQNCDGRIDENFPEQNLVCVTARMGICAAGTQICVVGSLACMQTAVSTTELCNGLDDDCDGLSDETFDFSNDPSNCGACSRRCDAGTSCISARCEETTCDDGTDNDLDGEADCLDLSCRGQACVTPMPPSWRCGARAADYDAGLDAGGTDDGGTDAGTDDGGTDAGSVDAGSVDAGPQSDGGPVLGCYAPEQLCGNGQDDDGDGEADCLDVDCAGLVCASGTLCTNRSCPGPG